MELKNGSLQYYLPLKYDHFPLKKWKKEYISSTTTTLPETNMLAPENGWLEYFLVSFWGPGLSSGALAVSFREGTKQRSQVYNPSGQPTNQPLRLPNKISADLGHKTMALWRVLWVFADVSLGKLGKQRRCLHPIYWDSCFVGAIFSRKKNMQPNDMWEKKHCLARIDTWSSNKELYLKKTCGGLKCPPKIPFDIHREDLWSDDISKADHVISHPVVEISRGIPKEVHCLCHPLCIASKTCSVDTKVASPHETPWYETEKSWWVWEISWIKFHKPMQSLYMFHPNSKELMFEVQKISESALQREIVHHRGII